MILTAALSLSFWECFYPLLHRFLPTRKASADNALAKGKVPTNSHSAAGRKGGRAARRARGSTPWSANPAFLVSPVKPLNSRSPLPSRFTRTTREGREGSHCRAWVLTCRCWRGGREEGREGGREGGRIHGCTCCRRETTVPAPSRRTAPTSSPPPLPPSLPPSAPGRPP